MSKYVLWLVFFSYYCLAEDEITLEKVQVTAIKKSSEFSFSTPEVFHSNQMESQSTGLISPLLGQSSSVIQSQNGGPGSRVSFFIRGTESRHVAFTLDGLKLNDPSNVDRQFDMAFFSSPFLKEVSVYKSPQSVMFGSDSLGGVIEMLTRKGENAPETRIDFHAGSFGTVDSSLSQDWRTTKNKGTLTFYRFHTDGISRLNKKRFGATEADSSDITQVSSTSTHHWNEKVFSDFLFSFSRGENELDGNSKDNSFDHSKNDQYLAQQKSHLQASKDHSFSLRNGLNRHQREIDSIVLNQKREDLFAGNLIQNEALYKFNKNNINILAGIASEHEEHTQSEFRRSFDLHSLFLQTAAKISHFKFHLGSRAENHTRYGNFYALSGGLGLELYQYHFSIEYSQGFKAPSLFQLYAPPSFGAPIGNPELVPEFNHSWQSEVSYRGDPLMGGLIFFQNRLSNLITYTFTQGYINQDHFNSRGIELNAKLRHQLVQISAGHTYLEFTNEQSPILRRPTNSFQSTLSVFPDQRSEVSLKGRWFSARLDKNEFFDTVKLNPYEVFDLSYRVLICQYELGAQMLNIFDREYEELYGTSIMPRSYFFHFGIKF